jgi:proline iminopeptidase
MGLASDSTARLTLEEPGFQLEFARLVTHYWSNGAFLGETELIDHAGRLDGIPGVLIHGRFDVSSPVETPWRLSQKWKTAKLVVVDDAGHGGGSMTHHIEDALLDVTS